MKFWFWSLFLLFSLRVSALARLGESLEQLRGRYGVAIHQLVLSNNPGGNSDDRVAFRKTGFEINVVLSNGVSAKEIYHKSDGTTLLPEEVQILLSANGVGHTWKSEDETNWHRDDGALASLKDTRYLTIQSKESAEAAAVSFKATHTTSLQGF